MNLKELSNFFNQLIINKWYILLLILSIVYLFHTGFPILFDLLLDEQLKEEKEQLKEKKEKES